MLLAVRAWMLMLSFIFDWAFMSLFHVLPRPQRWGVLAFMSSSWLAVVYFVRPFSNTAELWVMLALLAVAAHAPYKAAAGSARPWVTALRLGAALGAVTAVGVFVRFTAAILATGVAVAIGARYAPPLALLHAHTTRGPSSGLASWSAALAFVLGGACAFMCGCAALTAVDTWLFTGQWPSAQLQSWVLGPLNSALYNMDSSNTVTHGEHPHWQHTAVFMPALFSLLAVALYWNTALFCARGCKVPLAPVPSGAHSPKPQPALPEAPEQTLQAAGRSEVYTLHPALRDACGLSIGVFLALLSSAPHAEERFLVPLLLPLSILFWDVIMPLQKSAPSNDSAHSHPATVRFTWLSCLWLLCNILPGVLYSSLHQGGLMHLAQAARGTPLAAAHAATHTQPPFRALITFNTLMLPQFALAQPQGPVCLDRMPAWVQRSPLYTPPRLAEQPGTQVPVALLDMHSSKRDLQCVLADLLRRSCNTSAAPSLPVALGPNPTTLPAGSPAEVWLAAPQNTVPLLRELVQQTTAAPPTHCVFPDAPPTPPTDPCGARRFRWQLQRTEPWHFSSDPPMSVDFAAGAAAAAMQLYSQLQLVTHSLLISAEGATPSTAEQLPVDAMGTIAGE